MNENRRYKPWSEKEVRRRGRERWRNSINKNITQSDKERKYQIDAVLVGYRKRKRLIGKNLMYADVTNLIHQHHQ